MNKLIDNYLNGNITIAKGLAKRFSLQKIVDGFIENGYGLHAAYDIANFLKGYGSWQAACDAEFADRK